MSTSSSSTSYHFRETDDFSTLEFDSFKNTLTVNFVIFFVLVILFEATRNIKLVFLKRVNKKLQRQRRVPPAPSALPFSWIVELARVSETQLLEMVGLDGYMLLRYVNICFRLSAFMLFFGMIVMVPVYSAAGDREGWNRYTLANIPDEMIQQKYWVPVVFAYLFSAYFCFLLFGEYKSFIDKRHQYLFQGDPDTHPQTYYTVMLERIPADLRNEASLLRFFDNMFPDQVYSVEICLDLNELETLTEARHTARDRLEKAIAVWKATGQRSTVWVGSDVYADCDDPPAPVPSAESAVASFLGYEIFDAIEHYSKLLAIMNDRVRSLQESKLNGDLSPQRQRGSDDSDPISSSKVKGRGEFRYESLAARLDFDSDVDAPMGNNNWNKQAMSKDGMELGESSELLNRSTSSSVFDITAGVGGLAKESLKTATMTARGAVRGVLEATRTLELLTLGAYYKVSSTAFVTLKSRQAKESAHQMLLCQRYYNMEVKAAPNPKDVIWGNVSIPQQQIFLRRNIADSTLIFGALCWSFVVGFITAIGNLDSLSQQLTWLQAYNSTKFYQFLNSYLAASLLLCLLSMLPWLFDMIARNYEGMKLESEIQNSIMTRYFYYQLANIFVSVGLGSIFNSLHQIIQRPSSILGILGESVPQVSVYFTNLVIVKTFTALPFELLRAFPLVQILSILLCMDKKKCTRRELRTGAFEDPAMLYGWIYPNIMMILMIMVTYMCIAPLVLPFSFLFFGISYLMYKYQLLYVYITPYQSGGFMWYAVFSRSLVCLLGGIVTLICYLGIRESYYSLPFYVLLPLPVFIVIFWSYCENKFKQPSLNLSLESAIELDRISSSRMAANRKTPLQSFTKTLFQQPSLSEGEIYPEPYRRPRPSEAALFMSSSSSNNRRGTVDGNDAEMELASISRRAGKYYTESRADGGESRDSLGSMGSAGDAEAEKIEEIDRILADMPAGEAAGLESEQVQRQDAEAGETVPLTYQSYQNS